MGNVTHERNWTDIGKEVYGTPCDGWIIDKQVIAAAVDSMRNDWHDYPFNDLPAMPGLALTATIAELALPKVTAIAISSELAPYGLYGIEANYSNGRARVYVLDRGSDILPLLSDFWPSE